MPLLNRGMRRAALTALFVALVAVVSAAVAQPPIYNLPLKAKLTDCHTGSQAADRFAVFVGQMPALQGTRRMWMRFDLYERNVGGTWRHLSVPKFGIWQKSLPGKPGFIYEKRVDQLQAPADYRVQVRFRWYDKNGKLQRAARRTSRACHEPDPRPDLAIGKVTATEAGQGRLRYLIRVRNDGRSDVGPFDTVLTVHGNVQPAATVAGLPAGGATSVAVVGQRCELGSQIQVAVDTAGLIDESHETNNVVSRPCPMP
jgi:hypothetical protein